MTKSSQLAPVTVHIDEPLRFFLAPHLRQMPATLPLRGRRSIKDFIESLGIPHVEIGELRANGRRVGFDYLLRGGERIDVRAPELPIDLARPGYLQPLPLSEPRFLCDVHLGKLTHALRLLGFDTAYRNHMDDCALADTAVREQRVLLTRDRFLLRRSSLIHGYCVRHTDPDKQIREVVRRYGLARLARPFSRCLVCNGTLHAVDKEAILNHLPPKTAMYFNEFHQCQSCSKIYWPGSHFEKLDASVQDWLGNK